VDKLRAYSLGGKADGTEARPATTPIGGLFDWSGTNGKNYPKTTQQTYRDLDNWYEGWVLDRNLALDDVALLTAQLAAVNNLINLLATNELDAVIAAHDAAVAADLALEIAYTELQTKVADQKKLIADLQNIIIGPDVTDSDPHAPTIEENINSIKAAIAATEGLIETEKITLDGYIQDIIDAELEYAKALLEKDWGVPANLNRIATLQNQLDKLVAELDVWKTEKAEFERRAAEKKAIIDAAIPED
jgi:hypothetical protein